MRSYFILPLFFSVGLISCSSQPGKAPEKIVETDSVKSDSTLKFTIKDNRDSVIKDGEYIERYKNGVIKIKGEMKNGKREGLWKSWYEDGTPWSETTFKAGLKNGPTGTWYENGIKRYEGFYTNDVESGNWMYWDEKGRVHENKDYGSK
ncbi:MAG: toxin-antitoxin system YwqK family antitoxin [Bacteroidia bacterium]